MFYVSKAKELLKKNSSLSTLKWQDFEKLIAELLVLDGWNIYHTKASRDGGVDNSNKRRQGVGIHEGFMASKKIQANKSCRCKNCERVRFFNFEIRCIQGMYCNNYPIHKRCSKNNKRT